MPTANFLDGYELANDSVRRFWVEFPVGRLSTSIIETLSDLEKGYVTIKAEVFREFEDFQPAATGYAFGNVATYSPTLKRFYVEDTETSALARAIKTLSPSAARPSVEDMEKVERLTLVPEMPKAELSIEVSESRDPWSFAEIVTAFDGSIGLVQPPESPTCQHGHMLLKEGTSAKTGKAYKGYVCSNKNKDFQCPAKWEN